MQTTAIAAHTPRLTSSAFQGVKMGSALSTTATIASDVAANASRYTIGGGYWARMGAVLGSTITANIGGALAGLTTGLPLALAGVEAAAGVAGITTLVTSFGLLPVTFKHFGSRLLSVVPK